MSTPKMADWTAFCFQTVFLMEPLCILNTLAYPVTSYIIAYIIIWRLIIFSLNDDTWHLSWSVQVFVVDNRKRNKLAINNTKSVESKEQRKDLNN